MDHQELVDTLIDAWNRRSLAEILKLMDPQAYYYDAFWGETCSGRDLVRYFDTQFAQEKLWYERDGELIDSANGVIVRYVAYDRQNPRKRKVVHYGAEIIGLENGVIVGISDFYFDPDPVQLREIASNIDRLRNESKVVQLGLSEKTTGFIRRRLAELGDNTTVFLDPSLTTRQLADRIGCTIAHLTHVLEKEKNMSFSEFVHAWRANYAATLIAESADKSFNLVQIASQSGFGSIEEFELAFQSTLGVSAEEYRTRNNGHAEDVHAELSAHIGQSGRFRA